MAFFSCLYQGLLLRGLGCSLLPPAAYTLSSKEQRSEVKEDSKAQYTANPLWDLLLALEIYSVPGTSK